MLNNSTNSVWSAMKQDVFLQNCNMNQISSNALEHINTAKQ